MSELERWNEDAPARFRVAKAAYAELSPDAAQLERMLARVEQAAIPAPAKLGFGAKPWHWLLPALAAMGATLWIVAPRREPALVGPTAAPSERTEPRGPAITYVPPATPPPRAAERAPDPAAAATPAHNTRAARPSDPLAELALLDRARRVLARDPARALALAQEHQRHYAAGQFAQERELLAIEALVRLDRTDAAERRARQFRRAHPNSVHAHRLGVILSAERP